MPYESNRPRPADLLQNSQLDFLRNYQAIDAFLAADHFGFNDAGGRDGKHKFMRMQRVAGYPPLNNRNYSMIYSRAFNNVPYRPVLFVNKQTNNVDYPYNMQISEETVFGNPTGNHGFYSLGYNVFALFFRHTISGPVGEDTYIKELIYPRSANQPPFANVYTIIISNQNTGFVLNDDNADIQVVNLQLDRVIVRIAKRSPAGFFAPTGSGYFTVIGSI